MRRRIYLSTYDGSDQCLNNDSGRPIRLNLIFTQIVLALIVLALIILILKATYAFYAGWRESRDHLLITLLREPLQKWLDAQRSLTANLRC